MEVLGCDINNDDKRYIIQRRGKKSSLFTLKMAQKYKDKGTHVFTLDINKYKKGTIKWQTTKCISDTPQ